MIDRGALAPPSWRRRRAGRAGAGRRLGRRRSCAGRSTSSAAAFAVTASMQDTVLVHLASTALPGDRRAVPGHRLPLHRDHRHRRRGRGRLRRRRCAGCCRCRPSPSRTPQYGKDLFARDPDLCCALRKVAPLNRALTRLRGLGHRRAPGGVADPGQHPGRAVRRQAREGQDRPAGRLVRRRRRRLHRRPTTSWSTRCCATTTPRSAASPAPARCCRDRTPEPAAGPA